MHAPFQIFSHLAMVFCLCGKFEKLQHESHDPVNETFGRACTPRRFAQETHSLEITGPNRAVVVATPGKLSMDHGSPNNATTVAGTPLDDQFLNRGGIAYPSGRFQKHSVATLTSVIDSPKSYHPCSSALSSNTQQSIIYDPIYIDELGLDPLDQFNTASSVSFFNLCSSTIGYPTARLLQFRLHGIVSIPTDSSSKTDINSEL